MINPSDFSGAEKGALKAAADFIATHQQEVLNLWVDAVLKHVTSARVHSRTEIGDHLQNLLDDLIAGLAFAENGPSAEMAARREELPSSLHGRERASMRGYTADQVAQEYAILRRTLTSLLLEQGFDDGRTVDAIAHITESASMVATKEFDLSITRLQQKLIGTLVHDVRTPLGVAANYADLLGLTHLTDEQKQRGVQTITKSLKRAGAMLEDMLDAVTIEAGGGLFMRFIEADIEDALATVCKEASHLYGEKTVHANLTGGPVLGVFDMALLVRTVENLISNAVKFGDKRSPVNVCLEDHGERVAVFVHNQGSPIPEGDVERIFRFFSTSDGRNSKTKGWGLGLALIKAVVNNHGGEVILKSSQEAGTTFGMILRKRYREPGATVSVLV